MKKITINPVTRANSPFVVEVTVDGGKVVEAKCSVQFFRGFELILRGRDPRDASYLTERVCGICSSAHGTAAAFALEDAAGVRPPHNGNILRNLILGADLLQNHIRHFYLLSLPDYVRGPNLPPFVPGYKKDFRLPSRVNEAMLNNYYEALEIARLAHEMVALFGAKAPFPHSILAGGSTVAPAADVVMNFRSKLQKINDFIANRMIPDAHTLAGVYDDYYSIGGRNADMLVFGIFPRDQYDRERYFPFGAVLDGQLYQVDLQAIREDVSHAWYIGGVGQPGGDYGVAGNLYGKGMQNKQALPDREKQGAYTWVKAPRYKGRAVEGGSLARLWVRGDYRHGVSTMDRIMARVLETQKVGQLMEGWLEELRPGEPVYKPFKIPQKATGVGLTGAMRGPLGHWLRIEKGRIAGYQIITPTAWNMSPRDAGGQPGPMEQALLNTPVADENEPIEISRVVRAFDPCSACATHVIAPGKSLREFIIPV
ncbi:nickel-dependent hydrogenase large subunit [Desulfallas thermosapovorans]|uniref:Hydrogenase large subunit n=1 Tax=Desulfallas thermosapovorans DSM 6562 TaxID=1121431 RepID=A0A5S4ZWB5_9FIRM|nr:nickel-dependent hydrogenase large subunit [Desulfallas thermosapovorans]TYO97305.1 hydrogenase large subunit [Desulfallas thermosapovorans DSM 6562]